MRAHRRNTKITWFEILTDGRMIFAELDHILKEIEQIFIFFEETPVQPRDQVILTIRVIISITCVCEFNTGDPKCQFFHKNSMPTVESKIFLGERSVIILIATVI